MSIPSKIKRPHILRVIRELQALGPHAVPAKHRPKKFNVEFNGGKYPPKYLLMCASKLVGELLSHRDFGGGPEANNFLIARRFKIRNFRTGKLVLLEPVSEDDEGSFPEGKQTYKLHRFRERNSKVVRLAKEQRFRRRGDLTCDVCSFSFSKTYGDLGMGFIEAHHTLPLSKGAKRIHIKDLALVCSNCHRMLHRRRPWLSLRDLRKLKKTS